MERFRLFLILTCLAQIQGERSVHGIYHLLQGKKTSQTIQDAKLFNLAYLFQTMQHVSKEDMARCMDQLVKMGFVSSLTKDTYMITNSGVEYLREYQDTFSLPAYLNGWKYRKLFYLFWRRYSLAVQTLSCIFNNRNSFIPIINEDPIQEWVKRYLGMKELREEQFQRLYKETEVLLSELPRDIASVFVFHMTGFHRVGLTFKQIGSRLAMDEDYAWILFQSAVHYILQQVEENGAAYPELSKFVQSEQASTTLTQSTQRTYELIMQGHSIGTIAKRRQLKESTIEDHVVEIASEIEGFNIESYINQNLQEEIHGVIAALNTKRLKPIKEALDDRVSYFQIRLIVARGTI